MTIRVDLERVRLNLDRTLGKAAAGRGCVQVLAAFGVSCASIAWCSRAEEGLSKPDKETLAARYSWPLSALPHAGEPAEFGIGGLKRGEKRVKGFEPSTFSLGS